MGMTCQHCGKAAPRSVYDHGCHCEYVDHVRIAIGICCARMLGPETLAEEDFHDRAPWARPQDCCCRPRG